MGRGPFLSKNGNRYSDINDCREADNKWRQQETQNQLLREQNRILERTRKQQENSRVSDNTSSYNSNSNAVSFTPAESIVVKILFMDKIIFLIGVVAILIELNYFEGKYIGITILITIGAIILFSFLAENIAVKLIEKTNREENDDDDDKIKIILTDNREEKISKKENIDFFKKDEND